MTSNIATNKNNTFLSAVSNTGYSDDAKVDSVSDGHVVEQVIFCNSKIIVCVLSDTVNLSLIHI